MRRATVYAVPQAYPLSPPSLVFMRARSPSPQEEKRVSATAVGGAVISVRWSHDGQAIVTGGEDGAVKVWSRAGMLRTTLVSGAKPVFAVRWGGDNNAILSASGRELSITALQGDAGPGGGMGRGGGGAKALSWRAHDGVVLCADWAPTTNRIVSGGEDCRYRVWDAYGRQLFAAAPFDTVVTAVAWAPAGTHFAAGTHNALRLCDALGWSHCREQLAGAGSVAALAWTPDGTTLAVGTGGGVVLQARLTRAWVGAPVRYSLPPPSLTPQANVVERTLLWRTTEAVLTGPTTMTVSEAGSGGGSEGGGGGSGGVETLEFRDRVCEASFAHGFLVVATLTQCLVYAAGQWHAPHTLDLRAPAHLILQAPRLFLLADRVNGITVRRPGSLSACRAPCMPPPPSLARVPCLPLPGVLVRRARGQLAQVPRPAARRALRSDARALQRRPRRARQGGLEE